MNHWWIGAIAGCAVLAPKIYGLLDKDNLLEKALIPGISTRADAKEFEVDGGLTKTNTWRGYRVDSYKIVYDNKTGKAFGVRIGLVRSFVSNLGLATTVVSVKKLQKTLNPQCSSDGLEWKEDARNPGFYLPHMETIQKGNFHYACAITDQSSNSEISVVMALPGLSLAQLAQIFYP